MKTQLDNIDYEVIKSTKKIEYINIECGFDIETSSMYLASGEKFAFMYIWTLGLRDENYIVHGRTWKEFLMCCLKLKEHFKLNNKRRLVCYVHNLGFEFQFMRKYFNWEKIFSIDERKPLTALTDLGIEFRDSYLLSGMSLDRTAKNLTKHKIKKLVGDLDYSLIRHQKTRISDLELEYCKNDVIIILYYINEQIEIYGDITKVPLTNTGRVRSYVRNRCYFTDSNHSKSSGGKYRRYRSIMEDLQLTSKVYEMLNRGFMGGFTHANANYTNKIINNVKSIDFTSSYPAVMLSEYFPMSSPIKTEFTEDKDFNYYRSRYNLIFNIKFTGLISKISQDNYISASKCYNTKNLLENNGRVYKADELITTITEVDYEIIEQCYTWEKAEVNNVYRFYKGYLPKPIIESTLDLYKDKTVLKNVGGSETEYLLSKGMLNSIYGMTVTRVVRDEVIYDDDWGIEKADIDEQIEDYNKSQNRFLYYAWGVWVTAYARRNLWYGIIAIGDDYIYSDTDSIKYKYDKKHDKFINMYNSLIQDKLVTMCRHYDISVDRLRPKTKEGVEKLIGVWDDDGFFIRFKTLGAKRYLVENEDGSMAMTVAGLSKVNGLKYLQKISKDNTEVFNRFNNEMYIPADETGKMTHTYIDVKLESMVLDYQGVECYVSAESSVHLEKADFTLSLSRQYMEFIENYIKGYIYKGNCYI